MGHALMENRNGLVVEAYVTKADGHSERHGALAMIQPRADRPQRVTLGADKGYDTDDFVNELRTMNVTPHVAAKAKGSAIDGRPRGMPDTPSASVFAKGSRKCSAGARPSGQSPRPCCAAWSALALSSRSRSPPTIWSGYPSCSRYSEKQQTGGQTAGQRYPDLRGGMRFYPHRFFSASSVLVRYAPELILFMQ